VHVCDLLPPLRCAILNGMAVRKVAQVSMGWAGLRMNEHGKRAEALL